MCVELLGRNSLKVSAWKKVSALLGSKSLRKSSILLLDIKYENSV